MKHSGILPETKFKNSWKWFSHNERILGKEITLSSYNSWLVKREQYKQLKLAESQGLIHATKDVKYTDLAIEANYPRGAEFDLIAQETLSRIRTMTNEELVHFSLTKNHEASYAYHTAAVIGLQYQIVRAAVQSRLERFEPKQKVYEIVHFHHHNAGRLKAIEQAAKKENVKMMARKEISNTLEEMENWIRENRGTSTIKGE